MKQAILAVLAAASLAACGSNDDVAEDQAEQAAALGTASIPFPFPERRGCVSAPRENGEVYRVHAIDASTLELQVYAAATGALVRATTFTASRHGDVIRLGTFSSNAPDASSAEIFRETSRGRTRTILKLSRYGEAAREVEVSCDIDAGLDKIQNVKRLAFASEADVVSEGTTFGELRPSACTAPVTLTRGPYAGTQVRVAIQAGPDRGQDRPELKARVELVDPTTHFVVGFHASDVRSKVSGEGYELVTSYGASIVAHIAVGSGPPRNALTLRAEDATLRSMLGGDVPIDCDIVDR